MTDTYDVLVLGGGAAGLSGAVTLARSRRSVLVLDAGEPRNAPADGVHGLISRDDIDPHELLAIARDELHKYGGTTLAGRATSATPTPDGFAVCTGDGRAFTGRRLLVTTGLIDELPNIPGLRERWGKDVVHCPYCHGWEIRDQAIGVLSTGPIERAVHQAQLFRQLSSDVMLFAHPGVLTETQADQLAARDIRVVHGAVASIEVDGERISGVRLQDGTLVPRRALAIMPRMVARADVLASLGIRPTPHPAGVGEFVAVDGTGRTQVPGVWAAGNVTDLMSGIVSQAAAGITAAAAINADLVEEETEHAVTAYRELRSALVTHEFWDARYRSADRLWSGNPNPHLVTQVGEMPAGEALDVGCGEGADAIWLARQGWRVTGLDVSSVALERAAEYASAAGADVAQRITWQQADIRRLDLPRSQFDLVTSQYIHVPREEREALHRNLAAAVRPGGSLLIVGHHPSDLLTSVRRFNLPDFLFTAEEVAATLDPLEWRVVVAAAPERAADDHAGHTVPIHDAVLHAIRTR